jgi:hypothetical protein
MDSFSLRSLSISYWTLSSSSSSTASCSEATSSQSCSCSCSSLASPWMTCIGEGARGGDWCRAPLLGWVELTPPPIWLDPVAVVDMLAGWCSWTSGMSPKAGFSGPSVMAGRIWVDGWFWVEAWGKPSSGWRRWLVHRCGIVGNVFRLGT